MSYKGQAAKGSIGHSGLKGATTASFGSVSCRHLTMTSKKSRQPKTCSVVPGSGTAEDPLFGAMAWERGARHYQTGSKSGAKPLAIPLLPFLLSFPFTPLSSTPIIPYYTHRFPRDEAFNGSLDCLCRLQYRQPRHTLRPTVGSKAVVPVVDERPEDSCSLQQMSNL